MEVGLGWGGGVQAQCHRLREAKPGRNRRLEIPALRQTIWIQPCRESLTLLAPPFKPRPLERLIFFFFFPPSLEMHSGAHIKRTRSDLCRSEWSWHSQLRYSHRNLGCRLTRHWQPRLLLSVRGGEGGSYMGVEGERI